MKKTVRRFFLVVFLLTLIVCLGTLYSLHQQKEENLVLKVNGEAVYANEAMIYYKLLALEFEKIGGEHLWDLTMLGLDPKQTLIDRTLESIVRVKVAKPIAGQIYSSERETIDASVKRLQSLLGETFLTQYGISQDLLLKVVEENFLASRYEESARFRTSEFESDIAKGLEEEFGIYDTYDQEDYLTTVTIRPMMFYTGQWVGEDWISYSDTQKEEILSTARAVMDVSDLESFRSIGAYFSDDISIENNPVFHRGAVINPYERFGNVYLGQMEESVAEVLRRTKINTMTDIIPTDYGYLICVVTGVREPKEEDFDQYESQLIKEKETYREDLLERLKAQRMEEEWQRLEAESEIERFSKRWSLYVKEHSVTP